MCVCMPEIPPSFPPSLCKLLLHTIYCAHSITVGEECYDNDFVVDIYCTCMRFNEIPEHNNNFKCLADHLGGTWDAIK